MATVKKRGWVSAAGERKEAWRVRYVDQHGVTRTRQFALRRDADAFRIKAEGEVAAGKHTADRASVTVGRSVDIDRREQWARARHHKELSRDRRPSHQTADG
jgi:hypothetical protein